ncbi:MAG: DUF5112 domain-containing protein [Prevotella sp.]|nr:DUF5112 domain-containing protein [Prevotella sp.]
MGALLLMLLLVSACSRVNVRRVDSCNERAYDFHYIDLDSTLFFADMAARGAAHYDGGRAEALNNKAFVSIARMQYDLAEQQLDSVNAVTDNQVELLIADIQRMRLCQRQSRNKDFYTFRGSALARMKRISEEEQTLNEHQHRRMIYAKSEFDIVTSTYYYYVGLEQPSIEAIENIQPYGEIQQDKAQLLNYLYNIGAGGILTQGTRMEVALDEMDYLVRCYFMAVEGGYVFWEANSLQAMSEHLQVDEHRTRILESFPSIREINVENFSDSLLAGNFAQRSLNIFQQYGDVYQVAGAYRTLAQCYWQIGDYQQSLYCLNDALNTDTAIQQAPDLVASIREQLSVVYAALDDKEQSDANRNLYLDKQEQTRQDRYLESRAEQLKTSVSQLNMMILAILVLMTVAVALMFFFAYMRRKRSKENALDDLLQPLAKWKSDNETYMEQLDEQYEEIMERKAMSALHIENNKRLNLEQRAKVSLVNNITPIIDRMLHEIHRLNANDENAATREERYQYVAELTDHIIEYNAILTQWIQLRKGELSLHIESFPVQGLFDIVSRGRAGFQLKNIQLDVIPSEACVKADRILTLFMVNTLADNARKFTSEGGHVSIYATEADNYVEISVRDTGVGMTEEQMASAFKVDMNIHDESLSSDRPAERSLPEGAEHGHGFGLVNCKGIIEKYKKISTLFNVCDIGVESQVGKGSRFYFRLPKGVARAMALVAFMASSSLVGMASSVSSMLDKAGAMADSAYYSNVNRNHHRALAFADSTRQYLNEAYRLLVPGGTDTLVAEGDNASAQAEIEWFHLHLPMNYDIILDFRNEAAVAALALHQWSLYRYNNKVYTQLFKEKSADTTLADYCSVMQKSQSNKYMAIAILIVLLIVIILAYLLLYYRHQVYYRFCLDRVIGINKVLESDDSDQRKLEKIKNLAGHPTDDNGASKGRKSIYHDEKLPPVLQNVADQIIGTLQKAVDKNKERMVDIELAEDDVRKGEYENDRLYVCNSVLDNCLSTLKHETMYFPSRIRTLIEGGDENLQNISELADYYKMLYSLLSAQAMRQVESVSPDCVAVSLRSLDKDIRMDDKLDFLVLGDEIMLRYLFEILRKQGGGEKPTFTATEKDSRYVTLRATYRGMHLNHEECHELFNPSMNNLPFLLCRQIVRDIGNSSNARGCGILAEQNDNGGVDIVVTLVKSKKQQQ